MKITQEEATHAANLQNWNFSRRDSWVCDNLVEIVDMVELLKKWTQQALPQQPWRIVASAASGYRWKGGPPYRLFKCTWKDNTTHQEQLS